MNRIERVARALCKLDALGPDILVKSGDVGPQIGPDQIAVVGPIMVPRWTTYQAEATRFVIAYDALASDDG